MAKRKSVNWDAVETDYRTGLFSNRELAAKYGITEGAVRLKIKKGRWVQDSEAPPLPQEITTRKRYRPEFAAMAAKACETWGATDVELADFFDVSVQSINVWKLNHPEFGDALRCSKEVADKRVVSSLYHRAVGYTSDAVKVFLHKGQPVTVAYRNHVPPDTTACIFWLKNRQPHLWRDKHEHQVVTPDNRTAEELRAEILAELEELGIVERGQLAAPVDPQGVANRPVEDEPEEGG